MSIDSSDVFAGLEPLYTDIPWDDDDKKDGSGAQSVPTLEIGAQNDKKKIVFNVEFQFDAEGNPKPLVLPEELQELMKVSNSPSDGSASSSSSMPHEGKGEESSSQPGKKRGARRGRRAFQWPEWLPPSWTILEIQRSSGRSKGHVDKYYEAPATNRRFRSKTEVFKFLEKQKVSTTKKPRISTDSLSLASDEAKISKKQLRIQYTSNGGVEIKYTLIPLQDGSSEIKIKV